MKPITLANFLGINIDNDSVSIKDNEFVFSINTDITKNKSICQREGIQFLARSERQQLNPYLSCGFDVNYTNNELIYWYRAPYNIWNQTVFWRCRYDVVTGEFTPYSGNGTVWDYDYNTSIEFLNKHLFFKPNGVYDAISSTYSNFNKNVVLAEHYAVRLFVVDKNYPRFVFFSEIGDPLNFPTNNFFQFDSNVVALKVAGPALFVGTNSGLYRIEQTGDAMLPFKMDLISRTPIMYNTLCEVKSGILGGFSTNGRYFLFDSYTLSGTQLMDVIGVPISKIIRYLKFPMSPIENNKNIPRVAKNQFKDTVIYTFQFEDNLLTELPFFSEYFSSGDKIQLVLNMSTLGWTIYNITNLIDTKSFYDRIFLLLSESDNYASINTLSDISYDAKYNVTENIPVEIVTKTFIPITNAISNFKSVSVTSNSKTPTALEILTSKTGIMDFVKAGEIALKEDLNSASIRLDQFSNGITLRLKKRGHSTDINISKIEIDWRPSRKL